MPMVGSREFPYSKKGFADAKKASKKNRNKDVFRIEEQEEKVRYERWLLASRKLCYPCVSR